MMLLLNANSFGYFYHLCITKKIVNKNSKPQKVVLLADYHDKAHSANKDQRAYLESLLQKHSDKKIKLIVEDLSSVNNDGKMICCNFGINCEQGILGHLANKARSFGIMVDNVEYRYCRVASIGPLINNITCDPYSFKSSCGITVMSLYKEIIHEIEKIKKYNDGKKLNNFYKRAVAHVCARLAHMKWTTIDSKKTVACYCNTLRNAEYRQVLEKLCIFDSALIDSNIMHSIMCCDASIIFVVAGGSHIEQVRDLLQNNGHEVTFASTNDSSKPIDITILDRLIQNN
jgi:hypothetical protein